MPDALPVNPRPPEPPPSELDKVEAMRFNRLVDAGFSLAAAHVLSRDGDWRRAVALVSAGCPHALALRITR